MATPTTPPTFLASWHGGIMNHGDSVKVGLHLVYTRVPIGVILPRLISVESYQFRWRFLVLVLGPRRLVQHVTQSWKQLSNSKTRYAF